MSLDLNEFDYSTLPTISNEMNTFEYLQECLFESEPTPVSLMSVNDESLNASHSFLLDIEELDLDSFAANDMDMNFLVENHNDSDDDSLQDEEYIAHYNASQDPKTCFLGRLKRTLSEASLKVVDRIFTQFDINVTKNDVMIFLKYYFRGRQRKDSPKTFIEERNVIYAAFGYLMSQNTANHPKFRFSYEHLIEKYPMIDEELFNATEEQKQSLVNYYFYLNIIVSILKTPTKSLLIDVPSLLEGSGKEYILGSRQSHETEARVILATAIGHLKVHPRNKRHNHDVDDDEIDSDEDNNNDSASESDVSSILPQKKRSRCN